MLLTLNVLVSVTIGMGDDIHSSKASALDVSLGLTSCFMFLRVSVVVKMLIYFLS